MARVGRGACDRVVVPSAEDDKEQIKRLCGHSRKCSVLFTSCVVPPSLAADRVPIDERVINMFPP